MDQKEEKCECGMPLNEKTRCTCEPGKCVNCCSCSKDCQCGCQEKAKKEKAEEKV
ncbi:MAG: hypothetical protein ABSE91_02860 [Patescibacteria group bacterium]|jgi:hypothetical protein